MNGRARAKKPLGRPTKSGTGRYLRIPDELWAFVEQVKESEKRDSCSNAAVALLYEARDARLSKAA